MDLGPSFTCSLLFSHILMQSMWAYWIEPVQLHMETKWFSFSYSSLKQILQLVSVHVLKYALCEPILITCLLILQLNWSFLNKLLESAFSRLPWNDSSLTKNLIRPSLSKSPTFNLKPLDELFFIIQKSYSEDELCEFSSLRSREESILLLADSLIFKSVSKD